MDPMVLRCHFLFLSSQSFYLKRWYTRTESSFRLQGSAQSLQNADFANIDSFSEVFHSTNFGAHNFIGSVNILVLCHWMLPVTKIFQLQNLVRFNFIAINYRFCYSRPWNNCCFIFRKFWFSFMNGVQA